MEPCLVFLALAGFPSCFEGSDSLFVESGGDQNRAGLCASRAKLDGFDLGGGDVLSLILAKIRKCSG